MELVIDGEQVRFQTQLSTSEFPGLVEAHMARDPRTFECEKLGRDVIENNFEWNLLNEFISEVCRWGGYAGIAGKVRKHNLPYHIQDRFREVHKFMNKPEKSVGAALAELNLIRGLGTPSFASKHLRFLYPEFCPVLDQVTARLGYPFTPEGYEAFARDCAVIARELTSRGLHNPVSRPSQQWFCSEIDMALFAYLNGWQ